MNGSPFRGLSADTLAILAGLGGRAAAVTGRAKPATAHSETVTDNKSTKSYIYLAPVTGAHVLPVQVGPSDTWEERAAIFEFEGGLPRPLAEALAHRLAYIVRRDGPAADASTLDGEMFEADRQRP